jgi:hypothetical protein
MSTIASSADDRYHCRNGEPCVHGNRFPQTTPISVRVTAVGHQGHRYTAIDWGGHPCLSKVAVRARRQRRGAGDLLLSPLSNFPLHARVGADDARGEALLDRIESRHHEHRVVNHHDDMAKLD